MSRSLYTPTEARQVSKNRFGVKDLRQKPLAFRWWEPECDETDEGEAGQGCTGLEPPLLNGFAQPSDESGLEKFAFRLHADGSLEFRGHLDAQAASSGDIAFVLPGDPGEVDFRVLTRDQNVYTVIRTAPGSGPASFTLAMWEINSTTGEVTIWWPAVG